MSEPEDRDAGAAVAIVGLAGRFPGAHGLAQFWENLASGVESIATLSEEDLAAAGVPPEARRDPRYVRAEGALDGIDLFDARFFGFSPSEATLLDPQHRLFLECAWEALSNAGCVPGRYRGAIGVFAGAQINGYLLFNLLPNRDALADADWLSARFLNDKDFLATRASYLLDLKGPSLSVQTACSTSLVAVHLACRSLLGYECDMALAGGVSAVVPHRAGYLFREGGVLSPDGHCRAFGAAARGTVPGSGVGVVVLKRLEDALAEGDAIHAVVLGTAINNDGAGKVGFTAPSVGAQAEVIAAAQSFAGVDADTLSYVEAHGTGTSLGDPVEVAALCQAFAARTERRGFCALGSVKSNIGHLDAAAGVAGLIKTVLALEHRQIPPSLHAEIPNPEIDFASSPFYVNTALREWTSAGPRRAGVSSFGIGGTNAHAILEEAPQRAPGSASRPWQLLPLSARTASALDTATGELAAHLGQHAELDLADVAYTLQIGRRAFAHRRIMVCRDRAEAARALADLDPDLVRSRFEERAGRPVVFLFPGQGAQHAGMGAALYHAEEGFRQTFDRCAEILRPELGLDLRQVLFAGEEEAAAHLARTAIAQAALFAVEYGLARLFIAWGIAPAAMLGHSIGEYVAACLAGVFSLEEALALVGARGRLMQELPAGAMLSAALPEAQLLALLGEELALAAVNAPGLTVAAGPEAAVAGLEARLTAAGIESRRLATAHAFHSAMMEPALEAFAREAGRLRLKPPRIPYLSNLTGTWITPAEATDAAYWVRHLRQTVRFSAGVQELLRDPGRVLLELGPGRTLASFVRRHAPTTPAAPPPVVVQALPHRRDAQPEPAFLLGALGRLWLAGVEVDWEAFHRGERRLRVPLPTHPLERRSYWLDPPRPAWMPAPATPADSAILPPPPTTSTEEVSAPGEAGQAPPVAALARVPAADPPAAPGRAPGAVPRHPRPDLETAYLAPRGALEEGLAALWQEVLGIDRVGVHDDFFELGGHSLMATRLTSRIRDRFALEVPLETLFAAATVARLAPRLGAGSDGAGEEKGAVLAAGVAIRPLPRQGPLALSFAQQRLWFLDRLEPGSPWYNLAFAVHLAGALDVAALAGALDTLAARHESLRTTFASRQGRPVQVIAAPAPVPVPVADLAGLPARAREAEARRLAGEEARRPFDLARGPLCRVRLLRLGNAGHMALLTLHHIVSDGWSMGVLVAELGALYERSTGGAGEPLAALPIQYADFAAWQRAALPAVMETKLLPYWRRRLGGSLPVLELPTDRPRPPLQTFRGARAPVELPAPLTARLRALARERGATLFMTLLAGFKTLLLRYTEETDLLVGTPVANRNQSQIEGLIGLFVNTLVLRTDLAGDPAFVALLGRVRETTLGAYAHQDLPFERLVEELQPRRDLARSPLFQVMLGLETASPAPWRVPGLAATTLEVDLGASRFECTFFLAQSSESGESGGDGITGHLEYNRDLFDRTTAARLVSHLENLLAAAAAAPATALSRLLLLAPAETQQLAWEWNAAARAALRGTTPELILGRAAERPQATALAWGEARLSYGELAARAGQVARHLRTLGVGPEVLVAIACERSPEMVIGLLGVWLAGGAYLPLDPSYPPERLAWMLADSGAAVLLTQERLLPTLPPHAARAVCLDREGRVIAGGAAADLETGGCPPDVEPAAVPPDAGAPGSPPLLGRLQAENLAYVLYTSGSTGRPKGVGVAHAALVNFLAAMAEEPGLTPVDRLLAVTSLSFDIAGLEIWLPLFVGAEIDLVSRETAADGRRLLARLAAGTTVLQATPSTWQLLLAAGWRGGEGIKALCGGEALPPALAAEVRGRAGSLWNVYGPTETTIWSAVHRVDGGEPGSIPLGHPIANTRLHLLDPRLWPVPLGVPGELLIGGAGLARGYLGRPNLTAERFIPDPYAAEPGARLYRTGDLVRRLPAGALEFLGRVDHQLKVRGYRLEPGEVEAALVRHPAVRAAAVVAREARPGDVRLVAYVVPRAGADPGALAAPELRAHLRATLPDPIIPGHYVTLAALPLLPNGKVDRKSLPAPAGPAAAPAAGFVAPRGEVERTIVQAWREALGVERVGIHDNFFDLGGHSLLLSQVHARLCESVDPDLPLLDLFKYPTVAALAERLRPDAAAAATAAGPAAAAEPAAQTGRRRADLRRRRAATGGAVGGGGVGEGGGGESGGGEVVAVVGLAGRFPGAPSVGAFWRNLRQGVESITFFAGEELVAAGVDAGLLADPNYVKARGFLDGVDLFDAAFFGYTPREAAILDPQQRLFLEVAWDALENAGYDAGSWDGAIGVFAGAGMNTYLGHLVSHPDLLASVGGFQAMIGNDKDFLPTRVSYKLNLKGPSLNVQTACSTSLVAVHLACQQLLHGECDMALAGGATVLLPLRAGYLYEEGGILSRDGHCRPFDAGAGGTVGGSGVAAVVLKRLADALDDGDTVYAVIRGSAINNDGAAKIGFTAPGVEGQAAVIAQALAVAGVDPATVGYVETHGTATALGDTIEIAALTQAFGAAKPGPGWCGLGAVKSNVGHLDTAAGVAGLIKAVLALHHGEIPATLHFTAPNPRLDLGAGPFHVVDRLTRWPAASFPRRAGVSAFGIGGTNAHVVLEEAPAAGPPAAPARPAQLLVLSAQTAAALEEATGNLARHLAATAELSLADAAYTLQVGRKAFSHRRILLCHEREEAAAALAERDPRRLATGFTESFARPVAFLFPGGGAQHPGMARGLYEVEAVFRRHLDDCLGRLDPLLGFDLRPDLFPVAEHVEQAERRLQRTSIALPALFAVEYALAQLWMSFGVRPQAMIGHSLGEYPAACLAGVMSLDDALALVVLRGRLFETLPEGVMLSVPRPEAEVLPLLPAGAELSVAAVNSPDFCVLSGSIAAIEQAEQALAARQLDVRRLHISVAAHSPMVEPILAEFGAAVAHLPLAPPAIPFLSNVTGTWIRDEEATDPAYWVRQLRQTVRFGEGVGELLREPERVMLEVGPGQTLGTLAMQHPGRGPQHVFLGSLRHPQDCRPDADVLLEALGQLWLAGVRVNWRAFSAGERRRRVPLPTYPFERRRHWIEPSSSRAAGAAAPAAGAPAKRPDLASWFYAPIWRQAIPLPAAADLPADLPAEETADPEDARTPLTSASEHGARGEEPARRWLLLLDGCGVGAGLAERLERRGREVVTALAGAGFARQGERAYTVAPCGRADFAELLRDLDAQGRFPEAIVHLWTVTADAPAPRAAEATAASALELGFHSLLALAQALGHWPAHPVRVCVVSTGVQPVTGEEDLLAEKAALLGAVRVVPQEMPHLSWRSVDIEPPRADRTAARRIDRLFDELAAADPGGDLAHRGAHRWVQEFAPLRLARGDAMAGRLRERGAYLITGGLGGVGLEIAAYLARTVRARLVLTTRAELPPRAAWEGWLAARPEERSEGPRESEDAEIAPRPQGEADRTVRRIRKLLAIEALGGEVHVMRADAADLDAMRGVLAAVRAELRALHGVLHAAGVAAGGMVEWKTHEAAAAVLAPKLGGARVLARLLAGAELDFVVLCSAANSVLGGFGQVDLCAASAALDAVAAAWPGPSPCLAIDWDTWRDVGAAAEAEVAPDLAALHREGLRHGMSSEEGVEVFARALRAPLPRLVVATRDLHALLAQARQRGGAVDPLAGFAAARPALAAQARPALRNPYVAPQGEVEQAVAELWQEMMGIERVGAHDNFFQLGGHSLLATQIVSRLRDAFAVELPIAGFFAAPTVAGLAAAVESRQFLRAGGDGGGGGSGEAVEAETVGTAGADVEALMAEVEGLSPEEVARLLGQEPHGEGTGA
ncbi:MAG TPA: amino acid adenylation domain-containing protein [Thermoanaerobaculia bacterium]|nr:amino acid adenylation domain-containing protein [Thermoanaerobaculia bacterium]